MDEFPFVVEEDFAMSGEVVLFEGGGCEDGFRVEKTGELGYEVFALVKGDQMSSVEEVEVSVETYSFKNVLNVGFAFLLLFRRLWGDVGGLRELRILMKEGFCLLVVSERFLLLLLGHELGPLGIWLAAGAAPNRCLLG